MSVALASQRATLPLVTQKQWLTFLSILGADVIALSTAGLIAIVSHVFVNGKFYLWFYARFAPALGLFLLAFALFHLYPGVVISPIEELRRVFSAISGTYLVLEAAAYMFHQAQVYSRLIFLVGWILSIVFVIIARVLTRHLLKNCDWWGIPAVVMGGGPQGRMVIETLRRDPSLGLKAVALLEDSPDPRLADDPGLPPFIGSLDLAPWIAEQARIPYLILAMPGLPSSKLAQIIERHAGGYQHLLIIPDLFGISSLLIDAKDLGGILSLEVNQVLLHRVPQISKRAFDFACASAVGVLLLPLFVLIYLSIRLTSPGPAFYAQHRIGKDGRPFIAWKFRSMVQNADAVLAPHLESDPELRLEYLTYCKLKRDPRTTAVGRILRKTSLDELPQIWNVIRGDMSLVGPRPIMNHEIVKYGDRLFLYNKVRPGITGWWQISGRASTTFDERISYDEYYVRNWSIWFDIYILSRTFGAVLLAKGAY